MIVLDTNVVSELVRPRPEPVVIGWVDALDSVDVWISAMTAAELRASVALLPAGRRRDDVGQRIELLLSDTFAGAVLVVDAGSAVHYAEVVAARAAAGRPIGTVDALIAAVCRQHGATLATRNTRDFTGTGVTLADPWHPRT